MDRRDSKSACASLKWPVFPNGLYHGADPWGYTVEGDLYWNGDFHRVPALPSEVELEQSYPTYKFHPRPPMKETYEQKSSRIHQMQLSSCKFAQMRTKAAKPSGVSEKTIRRREKIAKEALEKTGEMHLFEVLMGKIWAMSNGSGWRDTILVTLIDEAREEWKNRNGSSNSVRDESSFQGSVASATLSMSGSVTSTSVSTGSPSNLDGTDTTSASNSAVSSPTAAAPARITPDKPLNDTTSTKPDNSPSSPSGDENAQPKSKKQKRGRREVTDLVIALVCRVQYKRTSELISAERSYRLDRSRRRSGCWCSVMLLVLELKSWQWQYDTGKYISSRWIGR